MTNPPPYSGPAEPAQPDAQPSLPSQLPSSPPDSGTVSGAAAPTPQFATAAAPLSLSSESISPSAFANPANDRAGVAPQAFSAATEASVVGKKPLNVIGLVALIVGVLGFIFACMPGALIVGWILLPIAFILSIVSFFMKGKSKWMGITGMILSVVGTIVGVVVFLAVVATSVSDAIGQDPVSATPPSAAPVASGVPAPSETETEPEAAAGEGSRENPYPLGTMVSSPEWEVTVNSVALAQTDAVLAANMFNEPPIEGYEYIVVNYTVTYIGDDPEGAMPLFVGVEYVTPDGVSIDGSEALAVAPEPVFDWSVELFNGGTVTGNTVLQVPSATAAEGVLAVTPGMFADKVFVAVQ